MTSLLVSIIIPCYNAEKWIDAAIDSALAQTYSPIEIVVVDDGSTDNSLAVIKTYENKIKWVTGINKGVSAAKNKGITLINGNYIQFLDADDYISPNKIQIQLYYLLESNADVVHSDWCYHFQKSDGDYKLSDINIGEQALDYIDYTLRNKIHHCSCLYQKKIIERVGGFDESLRTAEDFDFSLRIALSGGKFAYQQGCHYFYRIHSATTLSTGQGNKYPQLIELSLDKACVLLEQNNLLTEKYRYTLARKYFFTAKSFLMFGELVNANSVHKKCLRLIHKIKLIPEENSKFEILYSIFGWQIIMIVGYLVKQLNYIKGYIPDLSQSRNLK